MFLDNWILGKFPTKVVPCRLEALNDATVSTMMDSDSREWNADLLSNSIALFLVQKILSIPTCRTSQDDILVWPQSKCGSYTIRIGYQLLCELETSEGVSSSSLATQKAFWSCIWKLKIPNKMRIFCWHACSEALPTLKIYTVVKCSTLHSAVLVESMRYLPSMPYGTVQLSNQYGDLVLTPCEVMFMSSFHSWIL